MKKKKKQQQQFDQYLMRIRAFGTALKGMSKTSSFSLTQSPSRPLWDALMYSTYCLPCSARFIDYSPLITSTTSSSSFCFFPLHPLLFKWFYQSF